MARVVPLFCTPSISKMFLLCYILPLPLRFFPQQPHILHILNLKNLNFVKFKFLTPPRIKVSQGKYKKTSSSSFKGYNL
jgi:hypothetical protein